VAAWLEAIAMALAGRNMHRYYVVEGGIHANQLYEAFPDKLRRWRLVIGRHLSRSKTGVETQREE
jgi:hypothetical protein